MNKSLTLCYSLSGGFILKGRSTCQATVHIRFMCFFLRTVSAYVSWYGILYFAGENDQHTTTGYLHFTQPPSRVTSTGTSAANQVPTGIWRQQGAHEMESLSIVLFHRHFPTSSLPTYRFSSSLPWHLPHLVSSQETNPKSRRSPTSPTDFVAQWATSKKDSNDLPFRTQDSPHG